ncbi:Metallothionein expression activator [Geranomyces variabilis]|nr:Metallothionein expression activator [Geranomyces variabilis]
MDSGPFLPAAARPAAGAGNVDDSAADATGQSGSAGEQHRETAPADPAASEQTQPAGKPSPPPPPILNTTATRPAIIMPPHTHESSSWLSADPTPRDTRLAFHGRQHPPQHPSPHLLHPSSSTTSSSSSIVITSSASSSCSPSLEHLARCREDHDRSHVTSAASDHDLLLMHHQQSHRSQMLPQFTIKAEPKLSTAAAGRHLHHQRADGQTDDQAAAGSNTPGSTQSSCKSGSSSRTGSRGGGADTIERGEESTVGNHSGFGESPSMASATATSTQDSDIPADHIAKIKLEHGHYQQNEHQHSFYQRDRHLAFHQDHGYPDHGNSSSAGIRNSTGGAGFGTGNSDRTLPETAFAGFRDRSLSTGSAASRTLPDAYHHHPGGSDSYSASDMFDADAPVDAIVQSAEDGRNGGAASVAAAHGTGATIPYNQHTYSGGDGGARHGCHSPAAAAGASNHQQSAALFDDAGNDWVFDEQYHHDVSSDHHHRPHPATPLTGPHLRPNQNRHYPHNTLSGGQAYDVQYQNPSPHHHSHQHHHDDRAFTGKQCTTAPATGHLQQQQHQSLQHGHPPNYNLGLSPSQYQSSIPAGPPPLPPSTPPLPSSHSQGALSAAPHLAAAAARYPTHQQHQLPIPNGGYPPDRNISNSSTYNNDGSLAYPSYTYPQPTYANRAGGGPTPPSTLMVSHQQHQRPMPTPQLVQPPPVYPHLQRPSDRAGQQPQPRLQPPMHNQYPPYMASQICTADPLTRVHPQQQQQNGQQYTRQQVRPQRPQIDTSITAPQHTAQHGGIGGGGEVPMSAGSNGQGGPSSASALASTASSLGSAGMSAYHAAMHSHQNHHAGGGGMASGQEHARRLSQQQPSPHAHAYGHPPPLPHPIPPSPISSTTTAKNSTSAATVNIKPTISKSPAPSSRRVAVAAERPHSPPEHNKKNDYKNDKNSPISTNTTSPRRERRFVCTECPKRFLRRQDLSRHAATHLNGFKPYRCVHCGTGFTRQDALHRHGKAKRCIGGVRGGEETGEMTATTVAAMDAMDLPALPPLPRLAMSPGGQQQHQHQQSQQQQRHSQLAQFRLAGGQSHHERLLEQQQQQRYLHHQQAQLGPHGQLGLHQHGQVGQQPYQHQHPQVSQSPHRARYPSIDDRPL